MVKHDIRRFTWSGNHGVAELSDFNGSTIMDRLYLDACDVGFRVVGRNNTILFVLDRSDESGMYFSSVATFDRDYGAYRITLFND